MTDVEVDTSESAHGLASAFGSTPIFCAKAMKRGSGLKKDFFFEGPVGVPVPGMPPLRLRTGGVPEQIIADLRPWIEQEKVRHIQLAVRMARRGCERIEKLWDENAPEVRSESLAAATLDKHDTIIRRNLGMNETSAGSCSLNLHVLTGGRTIISPQQPIDQSGGIAPEKSISQDQPH